MFKSGTVVDAALIAAPNSTKNSGGKRDSEVKQSRKSQQWTCGMKYHICGWPAKKLAVVVGQIRPQMATVA